MMLFLWLLACFVSFGCFVMAVFSLVRLDFISSALWAAGWIFMFFVSWGLIIGAAVFG